MIFAHHVQIMRIGSVAIASYIMYHFRRLIIFHISRVGDIIIDVSESVSQLRYINQLKPITKKQFADQMLIAAQKNGPLHLCRSTTMFKMRYHLNIFYKKIFLFLPTKNKREKNYMVLAAHKVKRALRIFHNKHLITMKIVC